MTNCFIELLKDLFAHTDRALEVTVKEDGSWSRTGSIELGRWSHFLLLRNVLIHHRPSEIKLVTNERSVHPIAVMHLITSTALYNAVLTNDEKTIKGTEYWMPDCNFFLVDDLKKAVVRITDPELEKLNGLKNLHSSNRK